MSLTIISKVLEKEVHCYEDTKGSFFKTLSDSGTRTITGNFGTFIFKRLKGSGYTAYYNNCSPCEDLTASIHSISPFFGVHIACKNNLFLTFKDFMSMHLKEKQFNISYVPKIDCTVSFEKNHNTESFHVHFSTFFFKELSSFYPEIIQLLNAASLRRAHLLYDTIFYTNVEMINIVKLIIKNEFSGGARQVFIDAKITELVLFATEQLNKLKRATEVGFKKEDFEKIKDATAFILSNIDHEFKLAELARKCGLNEFKLKKLFKIAYGTTVFGYIMQTRLDKAFTLLHNTSESVTAVAFKVGFKTASHFCKAYKKMYGYSPLYARKSK